MVQCAAYQPILQFIDWYFFVEAATFIFGLKLKTYMPPTFLYRTTWGIRHLELVIVLLLYVFFASLYYITLVLTGAGWDIGWQVGINYSLMLVFTLPVCWFFFKVVQHWPLARKLSIHLVILPFFIFAWRECFYAICDALGIGHLGGPGSFWDLYIPSLFYVLQFGIFHLYEFYTKLQQEQALASDLREAALKSELSALKAQLNPHFLYNAFNTINASVPPQQEHTRELVAQLSDLFRYQLKASKSELVKLSEELTFVKQYLGLEQARFGERLQYSIEVDDAVQEALIPPMSLQPLVENAVKHGIAPKIDGGAVSIHIQQSENGIQFTISDTGVGVAPAQLGQLIGKGVGLTNTQLRLEKMYGQELHFRANEPSGLCVSFSLPLEKISINNEDKIHHHATNYSSFH
ncbi:MAG: histidine kinase [Bacteroidota bacterium]